MQTIRKNWVYVIFFFAVLFFIYKKFIQTKSEPFQLKIFQTSIGWGYKVLIHDSLYIKQDFIPAALGRKGFVDEEQAKKVGELVIDKMKKGKKLPSISTEELDSLHIKY